MLPRDLNSYGGVFVNAEPVQDPTRDQDAAYANRSNADLAQVTNTLTRVWLQLQTVTSGTIFGFVNRKTLWGSTNSYDPPTVNRSSAGVYQFTFPATFTDALGVAETLSFSAGWANIASPTQAGTARVVVSGTTATLYLMNSSWAASDLAASTNIDVFLL